MAWWRAVLSVGLLGLAATAATADDVIVLKNGKRYEGKVIADDGVTMTLETSLGTGRTRMQIEWSNVYERLEDGRSKARAPIASSAVRDEWWLLKSAGHIVGTRHLVLGRYAAACGKGWRLEENVTFFAGPRMPSVHVQRIEEVDDRFFPRLLHYRETSEGQAAAGIDPDETIRTGPVEGGAWKAEERRMGVAAVERRSLPLPPDARGPLGLREWLLHAPRAAGRVELPMIDVREVAVRSVRAQFSVIGPGPEDDPEHLIRLEDGDRVLELRCVGASCHGEDVAPGVVAVPSNEAQAQAAAADPTGAAVGGKRDLVLPECGVALRLPGASWKAELVPSRGLVSGPRVVARLSSDLHVADVRVEWDPTGARREPWPALAPETSLVGRLRAVSPDVAIVEAPRPVPGVLGAWRVGLAGTVREKAERVRTIALVAERGDGRLLLLASCQEAAWADAKESLEAILASFRWL